MRIDLLLQIQHCHFLLRNFRFLKLILCLILRNDQIVQAANHFIKGILQYANLIHISHIILSCKISRLEILNIQRKIRKPFQIFSGKTICTEQYKKRTHHRDHNTGYHQNAQFIINRIIIFQRDQKHIAVIRTLVGTEILFLIQNQAKRSFCTIHLFQKLWINVLEIIANNFLVRTACNIIIFISNNIGNIIFQIIAAYFL